MITFVLQLHATILKMKSKKQIQVFEYEGKYITFDFGDGEEMVSAMEIHHLSDILAKLKVKRNEFNLCFNL